MLGNQNSISTKEPQFASIAAANCIAVNTQGGVPHLNSHIISPYGITAVPPSGARAIVLPVGGTSVCLGVAQQQQSALQPGEIMLCSSGGASVVLKNNGKVLINGKEV